MERDEPMSILKRWRRGRRRSERSIDPQLEDALRAMSDHYLRDIGVERRRPIVSPLDNYPW